MALLGLLAGCSTDRAPPPVCLCPPPPPPPPSSALPAAVTSVVRHFDLAETKAIDVVLQSSATAGQIEAIRSAEARARKALARLGRELPRLRPATIGEARAAVQALEEALH